jgi:hypothetical protein
LRSTFLAAEVAVAGVEVDAVGSRDEPKGDLEVGLELLERARLAGVLAGHLDAAAVQRRTGALKAPDIVALPAVEGDGGLRHDRERGLGVDAGG